jgi:hypothetical protein
MAPVTKVIGPSFYFVPENGAAALTTLCFPHIFSNVSQRFKTQKVASYPSSPLIPLKFVTSAYIQKLSFSLMAFSKPPPVLFAEHPGSKTKTTTPVRLCGRFEKPV